MIVSSNNRSAPSGSHGVHLRLDLRPVVAAVFVALQSTVSHAAVHPRARVARSSAEDGAATAPEARSG